MKSTLLALSLLSFGFPSTSMAGEIWPTELQNVYLENCNGGSARIEFCQCSLEKSMDMWTIEEISSLQLTKEAEDKYMADLISACGSLIN